MLARPNRFTRISFERTRKRLKSFRSNGLVFLYGEDRQKAHMSVVVSKKVSKKAVTRNRLKRRIYELFRTNLLPDFPRLNLICLYKGAEIFENGPELSQAVQSFAGFYRQKHHSS